MAVNMSGVASGMDTAAIIQATLATRRGPIKALETKQTQNTTQLSDLSKLANKLEDFRSAARGLSTMQDVLSYKTTSSDETVVKATSVGKPMAGTYDVEVTQLAQAARFRMATGFASGTTVRAGELQISADGADPVVIELEDGDSLADVASRINGADAGATATVVSDGYASYLQLTAKSTGHRLGQPTTDALQITEVYSGTTGTELGLTRTQSAQNALVKFGVGPGALTAESRTAKNATFVNGLEFDFQKVGSSTVTVAGDRSGTESKVEGFMRTANELMGLVRSMTETPDGARKPGADPMISRVASDLRQMLGRAVSGDDVSDDFNALSKIGVRTTRNGRYELDEAGFSRAYDADPENISRIFTTAGSGLADRVDDFVDKYNRSVTGIIPSRRSSLQRFGIRLEKDLLTAQDRLDKFELSMRKEFDAMERAVSNWQSQGMAVANMFR